MSVGGTLASAPAIPSFTWNYEPNVQWYNVYFGNTTGYSFSQWYEVGVDVICNSSTCSLSPNETVPDNGTYSWWMQGYNEYGTGVWGTIDFNVTVPAPAQPSGLNVVGSLTQPPIAPALQWTPANNTDWYNVIVNLDGNQVFNQWYDASLVCSGVCTITPTTITYQNGDYDWTVQGWSSYAEYGVISNPDTFSVNVADSLPSNLNVIQNPSPLPLSITLQWDYDGVTEWFEIWVGVTDGSSIPVNQWYSSADLSCASTCSLSTTGYINGDYQWWIRGWNSVTGTGDWVSENFTVDVALPTTPNMQVNGSLNTLPVEPTLTWDYDGVTEWFEIWVGVTDGSSIPVNQWYSAVDLNCTSTCSLSTTGYVNGDYQWWIHGWSSVSGTGDWVSENFTVDVALPTTPNMQVNGSLNSLPVEPTLTWDYDGVTEWFEIWVGATDGSSIPVNQWYSAVDLNCTSTCSLNTTGYVNGDYQWWIHGWSSVSGTGDWASENYTVNVP